MTHPAFDRLVHQVARQVRVRRAEHGALRGAFYGAIAGVVVLFFRARIGDLALPIAGGLLGLGVAAGAIRGYVRRVSASDAARLTDRAFGLADRLATALEWAERPDRTSLVDALVADTAERIAELRPRFIVPRVLPGEARLLPVPVFLAVVIALAPAIPMRFGRMPDFSQGTEQEETQERSGPAVLDQPSRTTPKTPLTRPLLEERDLVAQKGAPGSPMTGDLSAIFKDTSVGSQRPDFNSFLKKGDDRLKLLEHVDRLPDLESDFTSSQYRMVYRQSKSLRSGLRPDQISPQKLRKLLDEMERLGRKGGNWGSDAAEGMEALESGQQDRALEAMEKALDKMRAAEEQQRGGKNLKGGREGAGDQRGRGRDKGGRGAGPEDEGSDGEGLLPGKGKSGTPKGEATERLRASPYDASVEGESRRGRKDSYGTNLTGRGATTASRLPYLGVIGQYRKMMEDAITREQVPRDYHGQIRDYFQALDER